MDAPDRRRIADRVHVCVRQRAAGSRHRSVDHNAATDHNHDHTSSTLPTDVLAFLQEVDRFENLANDLQDEMDAVNNAREDGGSVAEAETGFNAVMDGAQDLANQVAAATVPSDFASAWPDTIGASQTLVTQAQAVLDGLHAPDDGTLRREAVAEYTVTTTAFNNQLDVVRGLTP